MIDQVQPCVQAIKRNKGHDLLPLGVRTIIYSYLDILVLINKISKLCKKEREILQTSENLTQKRCLVLTVDDCITIKPKQLSFCAKIATEFELRIVSLKEQNYVYIVETLLEKIIDSGKPLSLVMHIWDTVKFEYVRSLFEESTLTFRSIKYQMMTNDGNHQRILQRYFQSLDKSSDIILDGNQYFFRVDFGLFPQMQNCRSLICYLNNDNFQSSLQTFPKLKSLYWKVSQLKFYNNSFASLQDLEEVKIELCMNQQSSNQRSSNQHNERQPNRGSPGYYPRFAPQQQNGNESG